jgi:hypothetical protein
LETRYAQKENVLYLLNVFFRKSKNYQELGGNRYFTSSFKGSIGFNSDF